MNKLYAFLLLGLVIWAAYCAGGRWAYQKCQAEYSRNVSEMQSDTVYIKEKVNEESFNTGADDIRHVLRKKYTIAE